MSERHSFYLPGDTPHYAPDRTYKVEHLRLEVELDFEHQSISGTASYALAPAATLTPSSAASPPDVVLDAAEMDVVAVTGAASWDHADGKLRITPAEPAGRPFNLSISYRAQPRQGVYFLAPDEQYPERPREAWSQGEPEDTKYWIPCFDFPHQKMTTEMLATVPAGMVAISNGALVGVEDVPAGRRWHFTQDVPAPAYLISLAAGDFRQLDDDWDGIPVQYFVQPGREEDARRAFGKTPRMVEFFSKALGVRYPYAKYSQVAASDFIIGGMENISATTQTDRTLHDERAHLDFASEPLVSHELAHQWFGDLVTCRDWAHAWLNEGFATYCESLWFEHDLGMDEFLWDVFQLREIYVGEERNRHKRAIVTNVYSDPSDLFDRHLYEKGGLVLHMLRRLLGEDAWWASLKHYLEEHRGGNVVTLDLQRAIEDVTGRNLDWFFQQWVYSPGHPELKVSYSWDADTHVAAVTVRQTQQVGGGNTHAVAVPSATSVPLFRLPLTIAFVSGGQEQSFPVVIDGQERTFAFKLEKQPERLRFDAGLTVLKSAEFDLPVKLLANQLAEDPDVTLRIDAARALGKKGGREALAALRRALLEDSFWGVQAQVARVLADMKSQEAKQALLEAMNVAHPKARRAVMEALGAFRDADAAAALRQVIEQGDASYFVEAEAYRSLGKTRQPGNWDVLLTGLERPSHDEAIRSAVFDGLRELRDERAVDLALEWVRYGKPARAREAAVRCLEKLAEGKTAIDDELLGLLDDQRLASRGTRLAAIGVLRRRKSRAALPALRRIAEGDPDDRAVRITREAIHALETGDEREEELRSLRDRVDSLAEDNRKLRDRLDKLESGASPSA
ncbi:MAG TPA: M1 family aminopeptidase [Chloroflexota bacterium]|nr:M1 family aminopeptidase [Chloroflexota bacterium]